MDLHARALFADGSPSAVLAVTVKGRRVVAIDVRADAARPGRLDLTAVAGCGSESFRRRSRPRLLADHMRGTRTSRRETEQRA